LFNAGEQMLLGIRLQMDAQGVVSGAAKAQTALQGVRQQAQKTRQGVKTAASGMGSELQKAMGITALGAVGMGVGAGLQKKFLAPAMNQAKDFQVEMNALGFVTNQAGDELMRYRDKALETAKETQFTPVEAVQGMRWLRQSGLDNIQMLEALAPALDYATASMGAVGLAESAQLAATTLIKFQHEGRSTRSLMDALAHSVRESKLQWEELPIVLNSLRIAPQMMHMTVEEAMSLTGALRTAGSSAAEAGENVNAFTRNLLINERALERYLVRNKITWEQYQKLTPEDLKKGRSFMRIRAMKRIGVEIFDTQGKLRKTQDIIRDMLASLQKLSGKNEAEYLRTVMSAFDAGAKNVLILLKELEMGGKKGVDAFDLLLKKMEENAGALRQGAKAYEDTQRGLEVFIKGSKEGIQVILGQGLLPILWDLTFAARRVINVFFDYVKISPAFTKALGFILVGVILVAKAVGSALLAFGAWRMWLYYVTPAIAEFGGVLGVLSKGFGLLRIAAIRALTVIKPMIGLFLIFWGLQKVWEKIWAKDATGPWKDMQIILLQIQEQWKAFIEGVAFGFMTTIKGILILLKEVYNFLGGIAKMINAAFGGDEMKSHVDSIREMAQMWRFLGKMVGIFMVIKMVSMTTVIGQATLSLLFLNKTIGVTALSKLPMLSGALLALKGGFLRIIQLIGIMAGSFVMPLWTTMLWVGRSIRALWVASLLPQLFTAFRMWAMYIALVIKEHFILAVQAMGRLILAIPAMIGALFGLKLSWAGVAVATWAAVGPILLVIAAIAALGAAFAFVIYIVRKHWGSIMDTIVAWGGIVVDSFLWLVDKIKGIGQALWDGFIEGMKARFSAVKEALLSMVQWIRDLLPGSDAKMGPLSTLTASGQALVTTVQKGAEEVTPSFHRMFEGSLRTVDNSLSERRAAPTASAQTKNVYLTIENMNFKVEKASPEEVEEFAKKLVARMRDLLDDDNEVSFA